MAGEGERGTPSEVMRGLFSALMIDSPDLVLVSADLQGHVTSLNRASEAALGRTTSGSPGEPSILVQELFSVSDARMLAALLDGPPGRTGPLLVNLVHASIVKSPVPKFQSSLSGVLT